jgi:hypothetical protein
MPITTSPFYAEWQFYLYVVATIGAIGLGGVLGPKYFEQAAKAARLLDAEDELQRLVRDQLAQIVVLLSFLVLIWIASGVFYFSYLFYVLGIGIALVLVRRGLLTAFGLETQDMKRRRATMSKLGGSPVGAGVTAIMLFGVSIFVMGYLLFKVISLRYAAIPAEQARLEMLLWVFGGQALFGVLTFLPLYGFTMLRPALDPYVRFDMFLLSLFGIGGLVIALSMPYLLFEPGVRAAARLLPGDIDSIYWVAGAFFFIFGSCFLIGTLAHNAQRHELLEKADAWLTELEDAQRPGAKSDFRMERSANAVLESPRMIGELIGDDIYLAAFWLWRYPELREGMKAFTAGPAPLEEEGLAETASAAPRRPPPLPAVEQRGDDVSVPSPAAGRLSFPAIGGPASPHVDADSITRRFRKEVQRALGFLWGERGAVYEAQAHANAERFSADEGALARWNPRVRLLIGYTELMRVLNQRERVLEIVEDLKRDIEQLRGERNRMLVSGVTMSTLGGGAITLAVQIIKFFSLGG